MWFFSGPLKRDAWAETLSDAWSQAVLAGEGRLQAEKLGAQRPEAAGPVGKSKARDGPGHHHTGQGLPRPGARDVREDLLRGCLRLEEADPQPQRGRGQHAF